MQGMAPTTGEVRAFLFVALSLAPALAIGLVEVRYGSFQHTGVALRLLYALPLAGVLVGFLMWIGRHLLRGSSYTHLGSIYPWLYGPVAAFLVVGFVNVALDDQPGTFHVVEVVRREKRTKGMNHVHVRSWRGQGVIDLTDSFRAGPTLRLEVHGGALGLEWIREAP